jgi:ADP-ribose pyrophosphatase
MTSEKEKKLGFNHNDYEIIEHKILHDGKLRLVRYQLRFRLYNGGWSKIVKREVMERTASSAVLPYDPYTDQVVLIEQFRPGTFAHPSNPWMIEIVAGLLEVNEKPDEVALREAKEEAGCTIDALYPIYDYFVSPGCTNEYLHIFCGKTDTSSIGGIHGLEIESENIRSFVLSADEAFEKARAGYIKTAPAIIALQWLQLNRHLLQALWVEPTESS